MQGGEAAARSRGCWGHIGSLTPTDAPRGPKEGRDVTLFAVQKMSALEYKAGVVWLVGIRGFYGWGR